MHRKSILALFDQYEARFPNEQATIDRIRPFVASNPDCFERTLLTGHVTGSAWILDSKLERALLTHHRKLDIWVQLGGHADGDSDIARVAMREAEEESGLGEIAFLSDTLFDIDIHGIPARGDEPGHFHYDCRFLLQSVGSDDLVISEESHDLAWIALDKVSDYTSEHSVLRMLDKTRVFLADLR